MDSPRFLERERRHGSSRGKQIPAPASLQEGQGHSRSELKSREHQDRRGLGCGAIGDGPKPDREQGRGSEHRACGSSGVRAENEKHQDRAAQRNEQLRRR